jgi:hypothetical protein
MLWFWLKIELTDEPTNRNVINIVKQEFQHSLLTPVYLRDYVRHGRYR